MVIGFRCKRSPILVAEMDCKTNSPLHSTQYGAQLFFKIAADQRAIFLKLRYNRCHQMQAATLQMIIYTPETEQAHEQSTNIMARIPETKNGQKNLWWQRGANSQPCAPLHGVKQLFCPTFFRLIQRPGKLAEWQEHLEAVTILHCSGSNPAS